MKPLIQSCSTDSGSKLYQVEITDPTNKSTESESLLDRIREQVEKNTRGTQEELVGDMLVSHNLFYIYCTELIAEDES